MPKMPRLPKMKRRLRRLIEREVDALNRDPDLEAYLSCLMESEKIQLGPSNDKMTMGYDAVKADAQRVIQNYDGKSNPNT
ncbi:hypothetical protein IMPR6_60156 [Imperialibacter sp. EC-SDR9]|nr:hypothetical protein IMPERIA89_230021 [Imperialibacter sp. 89]CAD5261671.1 hypothetical protein IMPERIA75_280021 [Imperialibacter sp. 75]VVT32805.1 hypothetical protein IMPR6_60156 [Imperialibacter sp. EC-SDR9]